jgi:hypothetical protein
MKDELKIIIELATALVLSRDVDVTTEDGNFATVDNDIIIELDAAIAIAFGLNSDDVTGDSVLMIKAKLKEL